MNELPLNQILCGDCVEVLKDFPDDSIDLVVTDPPYGLKFMGKDWDKALPSREAFTEIIRVQKPGALAFVMSSPRQDLMSRMIMLLENVGYNTSLSYMDWIYKTGFPKAYDVSKGIDKKLGLKRDILGEKQYAGPAGNNQNFDGSINLNKRLITEPASEFSEKWDGWKSQTGLKPAHEPILMVNKPFSEKTIVDNVLRWGTGAINVDSCRIPFQNSVDVDASKNNWKPDGKYDADKSVYELGIKKQFTEQNQKGRFPANLLVSDRALDTGELSKSGKIESHHIIDSQKTNIIYGKYKDQPAEDHSTYGDIGDQSRYFDLDAWARQHGLDFDYSINYDKQIASLWYKFIEAHRGDVDDGYLFDCLKETLKILRPDLYDLSCLLYDVPKPDNSERDYGLKGRKAIPKSKFNLNDGSKDERFDGAISLPRRNTHPTVKPVKLMAYLIELGCPPGGIVLDPFVGSGTTCIAAKKLVRKYVGIEINPEYVALAEARIRAYPVPFDWFNESVAVPPKILTGDKNE